MTDKPAPDVSSNHLEDIEDSSAEKRSQQTVKLDLHGFPLSPQPSKFKDDPLVSLPYHLTIF